MARPFSMPSTNMDMLGPPEPVPQEIQADLCYAPALAPPTEWADTLRECMQPKLYQTLIAYKVPWLCELDPFQAKGKAKAKCQARSTPTRHGKQEKGHRHARAGTTATPTRRMGTARGHHNPKDNHPPLPEPPTGHPTTTGQHQEGQGRGEKRRARGNTNSKNRQLPSPYSGSRTKLPKSDWQPSPRGSDYCNNFHFCTCNNPNCEGGISQCHLI